jgi:universal stress protein A
MKRILVPVDFSECSKKAVTYAAAFAKQFDAELILLHVVQPYPIVPEMATVDVDMVQEGRKQREVLRLTIGDALPVSTAMRSGPAAAEIVRAARELGSDLIVLSTQGHTGITRVILGSTAEQVVRLAPCPVLVVRQKEHEFVEFGKACACGD